MTTTEDQQETLHDISFSMGYRWNDLTLSTREHIMEAIDGSRGLVGVAVKWANEFDALFSDARIRNEYADYMEMVDDFFREKWDDFIASHVAERMAA